MRILVTAAAVLLLLTGCGTASDPKGSDSKPSASPSASPIAVKYTGKQLDAATPQNRQQMHGLKFTQECRAMTKPCEDGGSTGYTALTANTEDGRGAAFVVVMKLQPKTWKGILDKCPDGKYSFPVKGDKSSYVPGERGTSRRTEVTLDTWEGFACHKELVWIDPEGEESEPAHHDTVYLKNGHHYFFANGRTAKEAKELATEFLDRLEKAAALTS